MGYRRARFGLAGALCLLASLISSAARAEQPGRSGLAVGFGLGGGSVSWSWPDDDDRRAEQSGAGSARVAWALNQDLLVGVEAWAWAKDNEPWSVTVWSATGAVTYFPGGTGFFLRGGLGVGSGRAELEPSPSFNVSATESATGVSVLGATGYDAGITSHMSLGGAMHVVYIGIEAPPFDDVFGYGLTVQLNWYW